MDEEKIDIEFLEDKETVERISSVGDSIFSSLMTSNISPDEALSILISMLVSLSQAGGVPKVALLRLVGKVYDQTSETKKSVLN